MCRYRTVLIAILGYCLLTASSADPFSGNTAELAGVLHADKGVLFSQKREGEILLDGTWQFRLLADGEEPWNGKVDPNLWTDIPVPGCWDALGLIEPRYVNPLPVSGVYRKHFVIPDQWLKRGRHVFLRFDGVLKGYEIRVNGQPAGRWESAFNSSHFDVTPYLHPGNNQLEVHNYMRYRGADFDSNDDWGQAGINRSVSIFFVPDFHIRDIRVKTRDVSSSGSTLEYDISLDSFSPSSRERKTLKIKILDPRGKVILRKRIRLLSGAHRIMDTLKIKDPLNWTAETPDLYLMQCRFGKGCWQSIRFGLREITVEKDVLYLNGEKVKLRGVNYHDTDPLTGKVISRDLLLKDLEMMKCANVNFIRCSHYPKSPQFYDLCDSLGFYVMDEVPFGFGDRFLSDSSYLDVLLTRADATVRRDWNHPSVIIWSIGNENPLTRITEETGKYVKALDPTRPICYPMIHDYFLSLDFNIPDFIDIFAPHYPPVATLEYYAEKAKRPVICTEYCHSLGQSFEQQDEMWEIMQAHDNLAGGAVWEWVDQGMVDRQSAYPGRYARTDKIWLPDSTCISMSGNKGADGILYADRTPLSNYYELQANYAQAKILTEELTGRRGDCHFRVEVENRYDYINLDEDIDFSWTLMNGQISMASGHFSMNCPPCEKATEKISADLPVDPKEGLFWLEVRIVSRRFGELGRRTLPIRSNGGQKADSLFMIGQDVDKSDPMCGSVDGKLPELFLRIGRKKGLSEQIRAKEAPDRYLIRPEEIIGFGCNAVHFNGQNFMAEGKINVRGASGNALQIDAEVTPLKDGIPILEGGLAFLFDPEMRYIQWVGMGPFASYPGKRKANRYGVHALRAGDLYFEGNRMGVDAVLVTDENGKGYLLVAEGSNMNFENTGQGVVISVNDIVSGYCGKLRESAYLVRSSQDSPFSVSLSLIPFDLSSCPSIWKPLFIQPSEIDLFRPFIGVYDVFELPFNQIVDDRS